MTSDRTSARFVCSDAFLQYHFHDEHPFNQKRLLSTAHLIKDSVLPAVAESFQPDIIISQHGCDAHRYDPLTHLAVSMHIYHTDMEVAAPFTRMPFSLELTIYFWGDVLRDGSKKKNTPGRFVIKPGDDVDLPPSPVRRHFSWRSFLSFTECRLVQCAILLVRWQTDLRK